MAHAATPITRKKGLLDLVRQTLTEERAVGLYRRLLAINELSSSMNSARDLDDLYKSLASYCREYMPKEPVWLCIADKSSYRKVRVSGSGPKEEGVIPLHSGVPGSVIKSATPLWIPDTHLSRKMTKSSGIMEPLFRSILALPVTAMGKTIGCIEMMSKQANRFDEVEYHLGTLVAGNVSSALENVLTRHELATANIRLRDHDRRLTQLNVKLQELAHTDEATGLHNKRRLFEQLEMETARAKRYGEILSCMMIDVDNFKQINDTYGHQAGDEVLRQIGALLKRSLRVTDFIARYGGEEFTVILPRTNGSGARCAAEHLRSTFMLHSFEIPEAVIRLTISIGIASCTTFDHFDARQLLMRADTALYQAKRSGRNQTVLAEETGSLYEESGICQRCEVALTQ